MHPSIWAYGSFTRDKNYRGQKSHPSRPMSMTMETVGTASGRSEPNKLPRRGGGKMGRWMVVIAIIPNFLLLPPLSISPLTPPPSWAVWAVVPPLLLAASRAELC
ncbi:hypothetical protein VTO42DRAFT_7893 [Malbranchea cinnamomea]